MTQGDLAERSGVSPRSIAHFELGERTPYAKNLDALRRALEKAGVEFIEENGGGPGVRLRKPAQPPKLDHALHDRPTPREAKVLGKGDQQSVRNTPAKRVR